IVALEKTRRETDDQLASSCLLSPRLNRSQAKQIQLVLVETPLQTQQEPVIGLSRIVDRLVIDQERIDHAAHFDQLLPLAAITRKARNLSSRHRTHVAEADLSDHSLKATTLYSSRRRTAEVVIDHFDLRPSHHPQAFLHRVLEVTAFLVPQDLVHRGLPD